jgi:hypothetical protein
MIEGVPLDQVDAFVDLSPEMQEHLATLARVEILGADEEVSGFGAALLLRGDAIVCAAIVDTPVTRAATGMLVPSRGSIADAIALRVVAGSEGARVAVWDLDAIEEALKSCPWVLEELVQRADRLQALAGATLGPLGDLDEASRAELLDRLTVRVVGPNEKIAEAGVRTPGIVVVTGGVVEIEVDGADPREVRPGELLFLRSVLEGRPAPATARAGASGALLLTGSAAIARELMVSSPPFTAIFASAED